MVEETGELRLELPEEPDKGGPSAVTRYQTSIKEWPAEDRPRERLLEKGAQTLTDTELLAIILRVGNASTGESAIDHARHLLSRFGGLKGIEEASISELQEVIGIGPAKVAQIKASLEIAKRIGNHKWQAGQIPMTTIRRCVSAFSREPRERETRAFLRRTFEQQEPENPRSQNLRRVADRLTGSSQGSLQPGDP